MRAPLRVEYGSDGEVVLLDERGVVAVLWLASDGLWSGATLRAKLSVPAVRLARVK